MSCSASSRRFQHDRMLGLAQNIGVAAFGFRSAASQEKTRNRSLLKMPFGEFAAGAGLEAAFEGARLRASPLLRGCVRLKSAIQLNLKMSAGEFADLNLIFKAHTCEVRSFRACCPKRQRPRSLSRQFLSETESRPCDGSLDGSAKTSGENINEKENIQHLQRSFRLNRMRRNPFATLANCSRIRQKPSAPINYSAP
jgi:hypothetical protein